VRRYASSTEELLELLAVLNDPVFGICWDFGHANLAGIDQCGALRAIGKNLKALHVNDNKGEHDDHTAPYFGTIVWEPIMKTLKEIGYEGEFTYEAHNFACVLPDGIHDPALRFTYELGMYLLSLAK
jgi:L-ribulose-5-phosphate 3-epimerase